MGVHNRRRQSYNDLGYKEALQGAIREVTSGRGPVGGGYYYTGWCKGIKELLEDPARKSRGEGFVRQLYFYPGGNHYLKQLIAKRVLTERQIERIVKNEGVKSWESSRSVPKAANRKSRTWMYVITLSLLAMLAGAWYYSHVAGSLAK